MEGDADEEVRKVNDLYRHASWRVRLRRGGVSGSGDVLGAGVLLGADRVLTCAHVIRDPETGQRPECVQVDFPLLQGLPRTERRTATVLDGHWVPPFGKAQGDLALLVLDEPAPVPSPVTLHRTLDYRGAPVLIDGFPEQRSGGQWLTGACMGPGGHGDERVQINLADPREPGRRLAGGFSGAGVLEEGTGRLLGIVVQADERAGYGYMIPTATIAKYFRDVGEAYVTGPPAIPAPHTVSPDAARAARPHGLQRTVMRWLHEEPGCWDIEVLFLGEGDVRARDALHLVLNMADREQSPQLSVAPEGGEETRRLSGADAGAADRSSDGVPTDGVPETPVDPADGLAEGAPHLSQAGIEPRLGSISLVLDVTGASLERAEPEHPAIGEALLALRRQLAYSRQRGARPAVAVLGADLSATEPVAAVRVLGELVAAGARLLLVVRDGSRDSHEGDDGSRDSGGGSEHGFAYEMAHRLLPDDRAERWLERIVDRVSQLAATEERSRDVYRRVERRVVDPPRPTAYGARARLWTVQLASEAGTGGRRPPGAPRLPAPGRETQRAAFLEKLSYAEQAVENCLMRAERAERELRGVLDAHLRLRGLLAAQQARLDGQCLAEHPDAVGAFGRAQELLMSGPCPLADAERAVEAFARVVRRLTRDGSWEAGRREGGPGAAGPGEGERQEAGLPGAGPRGAEHTPGTPRPSDAAGTPGTPQLPDAARAPETPRPPDAPGTRETPRSRDATGTPETPRPPDATYTGPPATGEAGGP
ncbi:trypsin-like peptidase domain-containing protein [Streptomyces sp. PSKA54]|uniref:Trypsin-like peptidase domain-containing protein n=1 Tax=Streptomyces himalayensis subsp. aureolus TaxID=2758039 RepID=A0A7W2D4Y3_9ACTN|nr:serine protease [Streptomyces himalayensis]MBA4864852.1 trypsin-like peptidase domain-containing protein [Streptomyces himalayensis subsp. aureolus]